MEASRKCLHYLLEGRDEELVSCGLTGAPTPISWPERPYQTSAGDRSPAGGLDFPELDNYAVLSLGHENMYYLELGAGGVVHFFNRNGQCAAGSGAFWHQQATRMGYNDRELAKIALSTDSAVKISGAVQFLPNRI